MKKTYILIFLFLSLFTIVRAQHQHVEPNFPEPKFSYVTPKMDTLILLNNMMGKALANLWKIDDKYRGKKPVIIMTNDLTSFLKKEDANINDVSSKKSRTVR